MGTLGTWEYTSYELLEQGLANPCSHLKLPMCEMIPDMAALEPPADGHDPILAMVSMSPGVYNRFPRGVWIKKVTYHYNERRYPESLGILLLKVT